MKKPPVLNPVKKLAICLAMVLPFCTAAQVTVNSKDLPLLLRAAKTAGNETGLFWALKNLSVYYIRFSDNPDSAFAIDEQMLPLAQKLQNDSMLVVAYNQLAIYFYNKSDNTIALGYFFKALPLAEKNRYVYEIARLYNNIALSYDQLKNHTMALEYYYKALNFIGSPAIAGSTLPSYIHINLCETYIELNKPDSALKYIQLANQEDLARKDDYIHGNTLYDFGRVYQQLGNTALADLYYRQSIAFTDSTGNYNVLSDAAAWYGKFLLAQNHCKQAVANGLAGLVAAKSLNYKLGIVNIAGLLQESYAECANKDSAYYYAVVKDAYRDSIFNEQSITRMQDLTLAEQLRQKEEAEKLAEQNTARMHNIQYAGIAIGLITFFILYLVFSRIIAHPRLVEIFGVVGLLIMFEFINLIVHPFTSHITGDSPFLMLFIMVCIAGVLVPLHHLLENWIIHKLKEKNKALRHLRMQKMIAAYQADGQAGS